MLQERCYADHHFRLTAVPVLERGRYCKGDSVLGTVLCVPHTSYCGSCPKAQLWVRRRGYGYGLGIVWMDL